MKNTTGVIIDINLINSQDTEFIPLVKLVSISLIFESSFAISPKNASFPILITIPLASPLITLEPIKTIFE